MYVCRFVCIHVCMYVCMNECFYVYIMQIYSFANI